MFALYISILPLFTVLIIFSSICNIIVIVILPHIFCNICPHRTVAVTVFGLQDGAFTDPDVLADEIEAMVTNDRIDRFCVQVRAGDSSL